VAVVIALAVGLPLGPYNRFNLLGTAGTLVYIPIFILMNVAAFKFFRHKHRDEFAILPLVVAPVVSTAALITIGYKSIVPGWPARASCPTSADTRRGCSSLTASWSRRPEEVKGAS
jgi:amino acid transporter